MVKYGTAGQFRPALEIHMAEQANVQNPAAPADKWSGRGRLDQLIAELERQKASRIDFVANVKTLRVEAVAGKLQLAAGDKQVGEWLTQPTPINKNALRQLGGERVDPGVPGQFLEKLAAQHGDLAAGLLNGLMGRSSDRAMIRCLDGNVRAALSNSYLVLDHYDLAFKALEVARARGAEVCECRLSDDTMCIKLVDRSLWDQVAEGQRKGEGHAWYGQGGNAKLLERTGWTGIGDKIEKEGLIHPVVTIRNSETGGGMLDVSLGIMEAWCTNTAMVERAIKRVHLGSKLEAGVFRAETQKANARAIMMQASDVIGAAFNQEKFKAIVAKMKKAAADKIEAPSSAVDNLVTDGKITQGERENLLAHFLRDYQPNRLGLSSAVSRLAQDTNDVERADELEVLSGALIG